ncbi:tRNA (guanosine(46)-N7)-methyltransferase TrmB [Candidatus Albibeggiatoa sp. nov. NOAA]|uniref:tRNA (guanosine(46)-N7)-methyltransferase TrmB n=1 Tax=Candidatus Albibeggiatoa sp. nov. NOAA TaxID=3162724 RepID=UPI0032F9FE92|nr:tRNA (guanosine(46)-N7)-methyltransferase TrmB [Thiotrichaceae bacterium]
MENLQKQREIRSFVRRNGRITKSQQQALASLSDEYVLTTESDTCFDFDTIFGRDAEKHLEIGFGAGDALVSMAKMHPERDFIGIEVYLAGIGQVLSQIEKHDLTNIRLLNADAVQVLTHHIAPSSLDCTYIFFPDPWHKKRHNKRRLVQTEFLDLIVPKLKAKGLIRLATDWEEYAQQMLDVLETYPSLENQTGQGQFAPRFEERPLTKFERRGQRLGHGVWDLLYQKTE